MVVYACNIGTQKEKQENGKFKVVFLGYTMS